MNKQHILYVQAYDGQDKSIKIPVTSALAPKTAGSSRVLMDSSKAQEDSLRRSAAAVTELQVVALRYQQCDSMSTLGTQTLEKYRV